MDIIKVAQDNEELARKTAIKRIVSSSKFKLVPKGRCYYCDSKIEQGLFCDSECSKDYEWLKNCENRRG